MPWWAGRIVPFSLYRYISNYLEEIPLFLGTFTLAISVPDKFILKCLCSNMLKSQAVERRKYNANSLKSSFFSCVFNISYGNMYKASRDVQHNVYPWFLFYQEKAEKNHFSVIHKIK